MRSARGGGGRAAGVGHASDKRVASKRSTIATGKQLRLAAIVNEQRDGSSSQTVPQERKKLSFAVSSKLL